MSSNHLAGLLSLQGRGALDYHNSPSSKRLIDCRPGPLFTELPLRHVLGNSEEQIGSRHALFT
jgi:hypothetical protein